MNRKPNFSAGPAKIPDEVMHRIQAEMFDYQGKGISIIEISHRSELFLEIYDDCQQKFHQVFPSAQNHVLLFVHGGASMQFCMLPLNFHQDKRIGFIDTGVWSDKAIKQAKKITNKVDVLASSKDYYRYIPTIDALPQADQYAYIHITTNNTIYGTQFVDYPKIESLPLVADASSDFLSKPINLQDFQVIYGANQKNMGASGIGFAAIQKDFLHTANRNVPDMLSYPNYHQFNSMFNTPNTFGIYVTKLIFEWILERGGLEQIAQENTQKAQLLYSVIDNSHGFYQNVVRPDSRSIMNIPFYLSSNELTQHFLRQANEHQLFFLKGHKKIGGIRASIYNATRLSEVSSLADFMRHFQQQNS